MNLPDVLEGLLDAPTLDALFADVAATNGLLAVVLKRGRQADPPRGAAGLADARDALRAGQVSAVQLRYRHDGHEWWDTVMAAGPDTWKLIRIAHPV